VLCQGDQLVDVLRNGQGVLNVLPLAGVKDQVDSQIVALTRPEVNKIADVTLANSVAIAQ
jgi:hypothetical protein